MSPEPPASDVSMQRFSGSGAFDQTTPLLAELFSFSLSLSPSSSLLLLPTMHTKAMKVKGQQTASWKHVLSKVAVYLIQRV